MQLPKVYSRDCDELCSATSLPNLERYVGSVSPALVPGGYNCYCQGGASLLLLCSVVGGGAKKIRFGENLSLRINNDIHAELLDSIIF